MAEHGGSAVHISRQAAHRRLADLIPAYRWRRPHYQITLLEALGQVWDRRDRSVLDVGGGTGIVAQAVKDLFPVERVVSIDVENRYIGEIAIETGTYDGTTLPFRADEFDCVILCNVLHHVPEHARAHLLRECSRVARRIHVKDHLAESVLDRVRLRVLDVIGNVPFGGMTQATYISRGRWLALADEAGLQITRWRFSRYRSGPMSWVFPNSLEVLMTWSRPDRDSDRF